MDAEQYEKIPSTLTLRMARTNVSKPGFRVRTLTVITTLDAADYGVDEVASLYHKRWQVELDIRSIKSTMEMEVLACKTPENVRREAWLHLLAYNLCREQGVRAARMAGCEPRQISLTACRDALKLHSAKAPCFLSPARRRNDAADIALTRQLGAERVGDRPDRCEPRANKRRPKQHRFLTEPRAQARARLLASVPPN